MFSHPAKDLKDLRSSKFIHLSPDSKALSQIQNPGILLPENLLLF